MTVNTAFPSPTGVALSTGSARADLAGLVIRDASGVVRAGVLPRHTNPLVTARASMGVDVAAFEAVLNRSGALFITNDGTVTVTLPAAPSSNSRIDVVYVKQDESAYADADNTALLGVVSGTAAASPTAPAVPAGALALAQVLVPSTATTSQSSGVVITPVHPYTALTGGTVLFRSATERDASNLAKGARGYLIDVDRYYANVAALGWQHDGGTPETALVTLGSLYAAYGAPFAAPRVDRQGGRVYLGGFLKTNQQVSFAAATAYVIGTIPAAFAPATTVYFAIYANDVANRLSIDSAGNIYWLSPSATTYPQGNLYINLDGATWPAKQLG